MSGVSESILRTVGRILPNPRTVTLKPKNPDGTAVTVSHAQRRPVKRMEQMMAGFHATKNEVSEFGLWVERLGSTTPKEGDEITDKDGTKWNIMSLDLELERSVWKCLCIKQK